MTISSDSSPASAAARLSSDQPGDALADLEIQPIRDLDGLASALSGTLTRPKDAQWDDARSAWQLLADQHPAAVVTAANSHDVALTVRAAGTLGLRVAPQSTGHNAAPLGDLSRTVLLRTSALNRVRVDADAHVAHVEAGAVWGQVAEAAAAVGLTAIGGFSADVGVIGLILGGGLGWFARSHGAAADSVLAIEAITADGVLRHVDASSDLFHAILGGADLAVITAISLRLHPIADVVAGALFWPLEATREIFHAWTRWSSQLPEAATSVVRVLRFPDAPEVPPVFAGRVFTVVEVVMQTSIADADAILKPLRTLAPEMDTIAVMAPRALFALHMDPPGPVRALGTSVLLQSLPGAVLDTVTDALVDGPAAMLTSVELRQLGGALERGRTSAVIGSRALLYAVAVAPMPTDVVAPNGSAIVAANAGLDSLRAAVRSVRSTRDLSSFVEVATASAPALFGPQLPQLRHAKNRWDPSNRIHANHSVLTGC